MLSLFILKRYRNMFLDNKLGTRDIIEGGIKK